MKLKKYGWWGIAFVVLGSGHAVIIAFGQEWLDALGGYWSYALGGVMVLSMLMVVFQALKIEIKTKIPREVND